MTKYPKKYKHFNVCPKHGSVEDNTRESRMAEVNETVSSGIQR